MRQKDEMYRGLLCTVAVARNHQSHVTDQYNYTRAIYHRRAKQ